jgi:hypothetical protein
VQEQQHQHQQQLHSSARQSTSAAQTCSNAAACTASKPRKLCTSNDRGSSCIAVEPESGSAVYCDEVSPRCFAALQAIALVSDAGMPAISDPGAQLVAAAVAAGCKVRSRRIPTHRVWVPKLSPQLHICLKASAWQLISAVTPMPACCVMPGFSTSSAQQCFADEYVRVFTYLGMCCSCVCCAAGGAHSRPLCSHHCAGCVWPAHRQLSLCGIPAPQEPRPLPGTAAGAAEGAMHAYCTAALCYDMLRRAVWRCALLLCLDCVLSCNLRA